MSATGRGGVREKDDFYETPEWVTLAILPHLRKAASVFDPFAGRGAILEAVSKAWGERTSLRGIELDEGRAEAARNWGEVIWGSAFESPSWGAPDLVLTNPPYVHAERGIRAALIEKSSEGEAAFLLRLNFLGGQERASFHKAHPSDVHILSRRPSFCVSVKCIGQVVGEGKGCGWQDMIGLRSNGEPFRVVPRECPECQGYLRRSSSDATEYAWFVWGPGRGGRWAILGAP